MKIILVNYRYFVSGGPERYFFNVKELLERHGHEVIPFSVKGSMNEPSGYERYFLDSVGDEAYFANTKKSVRVIFKSFSRMFYSPEARRKFRKLLDDTSPDLVYIMQFHNKISPSIVFEAHKRKIPVIHRISDFQYMCPNALFYNEIKGVCEDCLKGNRWSCVKYRCVLNSKVYSLIKASAKLLHDKIHVTRKIDAFVVPSAFTLGKLKQYGIDESKLNHIPTFFNLQDTDPEVTYGPFALFIGRIEKQKGLMTLLKAFDNTPYNLKIIGFSNNGYEEDLKNYLAGRENHIEFLGRMDFDHIKPYLKSCLFTVVPSEWYDNFPNVILESFAYKKAVIATDFGSLPELVLDGKTGLTFDYGDPVSLRNKAAQLFSDRAKARKLGENAFNLLLARYLPEKHYSSLSALFNKVMSRENSDSKIKKAN